MADEEHDTEFESADAGASTTYPNTAGAVRKNGFIVIKGRPCKVRWWWWRRKEGGIGGRDNACENSQGEKGERQEAHGISEKMRETCVCVLLTVVGRVMYIYIYIYVEGG